MKLTDKIKEKLSDGGKLTIERFDKDNKSEDNVQLQINPDEITYNHPLSTGTSSNAEDEDCKEKKINATGENVTNGPITKGRQTISFSFILDSTGVVGGCEDVQARIDKIKSICYHEAKADNSGYVKLFWGKLFMEGSNHINWHLTKLDVTYTLFSKNGEPLRAKLACGFKQYIPTKGTDSKSENSSTATSTKTAKEGDSLPDMCNNVYGDASLYLQVAKANGLASIFQLIPGQKLFFPPLEQ